MIQASGKYDHGKLARKAAWSLVTAMAACLLSPSTRAQWVVIDPTQITQDATNFAETIAQYGKEIAQYQAVLEHYRQQLVSLTQMNFSLPTMQNSYQEISQSDMQKLAADACPSATGNSLSGTVTGLLQIFTPDANKSILENQQKICFQIQFRQMDKYNLTVKMLTRIQDYSSKMQSISGQLGQVGTSQGAMDGVKANIAANNLAMNTEMQLWDKQVQANDQMISYLQNQQAVQARTMLNGSGTLLGNVIQAATFATAFH